MVFLAIILGFSCNFNSTWTLHNFQKELISNIEHLPPFWMCYTVKTSWHFKKCLSHSENNLHHMILSNLSQHNLFMTLSPYQMTKSIEIKGPQIRRLYFTHFPFPAFSWRPSVILIRSAHSSADIIDWKMSAGAGFEHSLGLEWATTDWPCLFPIQPTSWDPSSAPHHSFPRIQFESIKHKSK